MSLSVFGKSAIVVRRGIVYFFFCFLSCHSTKIQLYIVYSSHSSLSTSSRLNSCFLLSSITMQDCSFLHRWLQMLCAHCKLSLVYQAAITILPIDYSPDHLFRSLQNISYSCWSYQKTKVTLLCPSTIPLLLIQIFQLSTMYFK